MPRKTEAKSRGVYERTPGDWWIRFADSSGRIRREKAGTKNIAKTLVEKRRLEVLQGRKLPESLKKRVVLFSEIAEDARKHCEAHNLGYKFDGYRIDKLKAKFGTYSVELPMEDLRHWYEAQTWTPATYNRYRTTLSMAYRLAMENGKASINPARMLKRKREDNGRNRFLDQYTPAKTKLDYLQGCMSEESRLRAVILKHFATHLVEFEIALHTGMRPSEQYGLKWENVDLARKLVTIPKSKNGKTRHIPLNSVALAGFQELFGRSKGKGWVFIGKDGDRLKGYKHWFDDTIAEAGLADFTWYCLRHTFASRLVMKGVDIRTVAELMGHRTIQMTMRYAHLAQSHKLSAVELLATVQLPEPTPEKQSQETTDTTTDTSDLEHVVSASEHVH